MTAIVISTKPPGSAHLNITLDDWSSVRLEVPLDYWDPSRGVTAVAFLKLSATNATSNTRSLLINPGGPRGSGIESIFSQGLALAGLLQGQHNIVGFDPRGVGLSGPSVDCWPGNPEGRAQQFAAAEIFGEVCSSIVGGLNGSAAFVSTPAVARDMLSFVEAEQKQRPAKNESDNEQAKLCNLFRSQFIFQAMYIPAERLPKLAAILAGLEQSNTTAYAIAVTGGTIPASPCNYAPSTATRDVDTLKKCVDGAGEKRFRSISQFEDYVDVLTSQSEFFGEVWPNNANGVACRAFEVSPPETKKLKDTILDSRQTASRILFVTTEVDPVAPKRGTCQADAEPFW
ncbi:hypothetical protein AN1144.2 [Aspergillus nidulans FGSC A4]|nr:hypothetical protein AN1144.2 [Aspergillus nidulans FGSC A4]|eukprot:XP_658748.1 hypothetical protein AN1144.2 [Aspergillus nidulans FGSC A4]